MKRRLLFLTESELELVRIMLDDWENSEDYEQTFSNGMKHQTLRNALEKVNSAPTLTRKHLSNFDFLIGSTWCSEEDYACFIPDPRTRRSIQNSWERFISSFSKGANR